MLRRKRTEHQKNAFSKPPHCDEENALTDAADSVAGGAGAGAGAAQGGALGRGVAGPVPAARSRVASLILHEKGHKLGILSLMNTGPIGYSNNAGKPKSVTVSDCHSIR